MRSTFLLVHSPSVGPSTWAPVARSLERQGHTAVVPDLTGVPAGGPPYWPRVVDAVRAAAPETPLVIVAHSNAGFFVPVIKEALGERVVACVFADAHIPPRQGLVRTAEEAFLPFLHDLAGPDGVLPRWTDWWDEEDVVAMLPDPAERVRVAAEQPRLPLDYYTQPIPVPAGWDEVRCSCLWYSRPYDKAAEEAARRGWPVTRLPGEHLHQLVSPDDVAAALLKLSRTT
ncbi:alpha/beta hydrolase [Nonomuraea aridisoli]|uniref:Alpha/beta hydrolase n=1 Tax=Nonomuraea aridisoli TaxID=2070368 RepID=A0A2W2EAG8_9ACTN|nr:alpha/beta hydrolase [Nonomuraea aridisoli]PZG08958.1 alpha/beta hydrolase [Nonomuraea aridisoli]